VGMQTGFNESLNEAFSLAFGASSKMFGEQFTTKFLTGFGRSFAKNFGFMAQGYVAGGLQSPGAYVGLMYGAGRTIWDVITGMFGRKKDDKDDTAKRKGMPPLDQKPSRVEGFFDPIALARRIQESALKEDDKIVSAIQMQTEILAQAFKGGEVAQGDVALP
jgi:hypothetical protein